MELKGLRSFRFPCVLVDGLICVPCQWFRTDSSRRYIWGIYQNIEYLRYILFQSNSVASYFFIYCELVVFFSSELYRLFSILFV